MAGNVRRTWDKEAYELKARERAAQAEAGAGAEGGSVDAETAEGGAVRRSGGSEVKEEFLPAAAGAAGPVGSVRAFVKAREGKLDLDSKVGKTQIVTAAAIEAGVGAGYWCEVCSCVLKDSVAYLDHINGKKHQRTLGYSMRVERVGADTVKSKLEALKRKLAEGSSSSSSSSLVSAQASSSASSAGAQSEGGALDEEMRKKRKKEDQEMRRKEREAADLEDADPEIAEMMGFGGFGPSKRR